MIRFLSNDSVTVSGDETDGAKGAQCRKSIHDDGATLNPSDKTHHVQVTCQPFGIYESPAPALECLPAFETLSSPVFASSQSVEFISPPPHWVRENAPRAATQTFPEGTFTLTNAPSLLLPYLLHPESPYPFKPFSERIDAITKAIAAADCIEDPNCPNTCTSRVSDLCSTLKDLHISQPDIRVSDYVWNPKSHVAYGGNSKAARGRSGSSPAQALQISWGGNNEGSSRPGGGREREGGGDGDGSDGNGDSGTG